MSHLTLVHGRNSLPLVCTCCYCGAVQSVPYPPELVDCVRCGRGFRLFYNSSGVKLELGKDAVKFFVDSPKRDA